LLGGRKLTWPPGWFLEIFPIWINILSETFFSLILLYQQYLFWIASHQSKFS
jgi:hypothetical protein